VTACDCGWRVDRANATSLLAMPVCGSTASRRLPGSYVELEGTETRSSIASSHTTQKTADLVEEYWHAIQPVAGPC